MHYNTFYYNNVQTLASNKQKISQDIYLYNKVYNKHITDLDLSNDNVDSNILLILQPVTPLNGVEAARPEQMLELQQQALESLNDVRIIPQTHRMMDQL